MDNREAMRTRYGHGNAIGETQHDGNMGYGTDDTVGALGNLIANRSERLVPVVANADDMIAVHLMRNKQAIRFCCRTERLEHAAAVLANRCGIIAHMRAKIERSIRRR